MADGFKINVSITKRTQENTDAEVQALAEKLKSKAEELANAMTENGIRPIGERKGGTTYASDISVDVNTFPTKDGEIGKSPTLTIRNGKDIIEARASLSADLKSVFVKQYDDAQGKYITAEKSNLSKETADIVNVIENHIDPEQTKDKDLDNAASGIQVYANKNLDYVAEDKREIAGKVIDFVADHAAKALAKNLDENNIVPKGIDKDGKEYNSSIKVTVDTQKDENGEQTFKPMLNIPNGKDTIEVHLKRVENNERSNYFLSSVTIKQFDNEGAHHFKLADAPEMSAGTAEIANHIATAIERGSINYETNTQAYSHGEASGVQVYANKNLDYVAEDKREVAGKGIDFVASQAAKALAKNLDEHNIIPKGVDKDGKEYNSSIKVTVDTQKDENGEQTFKPMLNIPNGKDTIEVHLKRVENNDKTNYIMSSVTIKQFDNEGAHHFKLADAPEMSAGTAEIANHIATSIELANISYDANTQVFSQGDKYISKDEKVVNDAFSTVSMNNKSFAQALIDNGFATDIAKENGLDCVQFRNHTDEKQVIYIGKTPDNEMVAVAVNYDQREDGKYVSKMIQSSDDVSFIRDPQIAKYVDDKILSGDDAKEKVKTDIER